MAIRFIDSNLPDKSWFIDLDPEYKSVWVHLILKCNHAGVWNVSIKLLNTFIGGNKDLTEESILKIFGNRIIPFDNDKWFLPGFITFQYKYGLNPSNRVHKSVIEILNKQDLMNHLRGFDESYMTLIRPINGSLMAQDRDKDGAQELDKELDKDKKKELYSEDKANEKKAEKKRIRKLELKRNLEQFELLWIEYPNKSGKKPSGDKYKVLMPDEDLFNKIYADIVERSKSYKWREEDGKYVPHLKTYLNQERWNDDMLPVDAPAVERSSGGRAPYIEDEEDD